MYGYLNKIGVRLLIDSKIDVVELGDKFMHGGTNIRVEGKTCQCNFQQLLHLFLDILRFHDI